MGSLSKVGLLCVVVDNFDFIAITILPQEAYAEPIVEPYAVLTLPVSPELFKPVAWREYQVLKTRAIIEHT